MRLEHWNLLIEYHGISDIWILFTSGRKEIFSSLWMMWLVYTIRSVDYIVRGKYYFGLLRLIAVWGWNVWLNLAVWLIHNYGETLILFGTAGKPHIILNTLPHFKYLFVAFELINYLLKFRPLLLIHPVYKPNWLGVRIEWGPSNDEPREYR